MEGRICRIVGAGPFEPETFRRGKDDLVVAADGGFAYLKALGVEPSLSLGDFDSLGYTPESAEKFPAEKDDTDMLLAVKRAMNLGCSVFYIYGGLGGRLSHTLGNIQTLRFIADGGGAGFLVEKGSVVTLIENSSAVFREGCRGLLSVLCLGDRAEGVSISGLKYPLENYTMLPSYPIGVSNAFTGLRAEVSVSRGALALVWEDEDADAGMIEISKQ